MQWLSGNNDWPGATPIICPNFAVIGACFEATTGAARVSAGPIGVVIGLALYQLDVCNRNPWLR